ncbi:MAG TPA: molybdopterin-dependent oxidoreductase [Pirellulaceae bacterium]|nr:molybdopterin-dependent oxidoreductase [Pirellulaceae bacterium]
MIDLTDDHYALDIDRARYVLGWEPKHTLRETLPEMVSSLKADPVMWYRENKLEPPAWILQGGHAIAKSPSPLFVEDLMNEQRKMVVSTPENSETPLENVHSWVTPNGLFFVRNHFDVPEIDVSEWRLQVHGCVGQELNLTWERLESFPTRSVFATMECAGNGRSFLQPPAEGVPWGAGAIGHAEWTGVPLKFVLQAAGLNPGVVEIVCEGADRGAENDQPEPVPFARSLPLENALHPDTLLATRMNGEPLAPSHGFPVRLLVPGWCGIASIKWLRRLEAVDMPYTGYYQTVKYTVQRRTGRGQQTEMIGAMPVKSELVRPREGETLGLGTNRLFGLAWAGEDEIAAVEVSVDGGRRWAAAELIGPRARYSWCLWEYLWSVGSAGEYTLLSRAISASGDIQPTRHDPLCGGYLINFSRPTLVRVDADRRSRDLAGDTTTLLHEMNLLAEERSRYRLDVELELTSGAGI